MSVVPLPILLVQDNLSLFSESVTNIFTNKTQPHGWESCQNRLGPPPLPNPNIVPPNPNISEI